MRPVAQTSGGELRFERLYRDDDTSDHGQHWERTNAGVTLETVERLLIGVDWDSTGYEICVLDVAGAIVEQYRVKHRADELGEFVRRLMDRVGSREEALAVAIETPRGALVELLLERKIPVYAITPKQAERLRDRHRPSGAKDDRLDAYILADGLRHDRHLFRRVEADHSLIIELREVTRADEDLGQEWNRLSNQVRQQLQRTHPHLLELARNGQTPWFWELIEAVVVKESRLTKAKIRSLLERHRIRRWTPEDVEAAVKEPMLRVASGTLKAVQLQLDLLLPRLRLVDTQRRACGKRMEELLDLYAQETHQGKASAPSTIEIVRSLPGVGVRVASILLSEASHQLESAEPGALLRAYSGVAPITRRSGKKISVLRRYSCNRRLQHGLYHQARTSLQSDSLARAYYASLRARGHTHGRALRAVADRWLRILDAMLRTRTVYDSARLRAATANLVAQTRQAAA